jgi:hypothetical protein
MGKQMPEVGTKIYKIAKTGNPCRPTCSVSGWGIRNTHDLPTSPIRQWLTFKNPLLPYESGPGIFERIVAFRGPAKISVPDDL